MSEKKYKKYYVSIYCKIYTENYNDLEGEHTGDEIVAHLLEDCGCAYDKNDIKITGDPNIWYLGCNQKFGDIFIEIEDSKERFEAKRWKWSFGESSFDIVEDFINYMLQHNVITEEQYKTLKEKVDEGRLINDMYLIGEYLKCKREGKEWIPQETDMRAEMKNMADCVSESLKEKGNDVYIAGKDY